MESSIKFTYKKQPTDAGREGELIFRLVYQQAGCRKPFDRLWISSMEDSAIREGFRHLKPGTEYDLLYEAALCRERADWIVGINATRLFSCLYNQTLNVGRVMTPTLAMIVLRDAQIEAFSPTPFYTVQISYDGGMAASRRFDKKEEAAALLDACRKEAKVTVKSVERKEKTEHPPLLYDLTSLQRDANRILGYTAQQTLDYTQSLYEKKLVTYPRTDSRYLTDDMLQTLPDLISIVSAKFGLEGVPVTQPQRIVDSSKVSDHHAIIPTKTMTEADLSELPAGEKAILQMISVCLMCAAGEDYRYAETASVVTCGGEEFTSKNKVILQNGWKDIWQRFYPVKAKENEADSAMGEMTAGMSFKPVKMEVKEGKTASPKHFTDVLF